VGSRGRSLSGSALGRTSGGTFGAHWVALAGMVEAWLRVGRTALTRGD
jgi:hypothetical protein